MWGASMSELNCAGASNFGVSVYDALEGAELYNGYDYITGDSRTWSNQPNHNEAIVRGYLNSSQGGSVSNQRDLKVAQILLLFADPFLGNEYK